jgi:1-aminocyclopropane-1-carboxylate deaminase/D-cysteine desulfhydrase-like pyridoxal-dependent ACC family enzyme
VSVGAAELRRRLDDLPRYPLAALPTPLQAAPNLSRALGGVEVLIKRDDLTGLAMGGNKARKLELIVADAQAQGADMLLTTAAAQSNFCRMTAGAARQAGMRAGLLLRGRGDEPAQGNLLLDRILGAEIRFTQNMDPYAEESHQRLLAWVAEERHAGHQPYLVYIHGGSRPGALATLGYVAGALELADQLAALGKRADHLYVAVGSGGTLAGLLLGLRWLDLATRVVGVCVGALSDAVAPKTVEFMDAGAALLGLENAYAADVLLTDSQRGPAYGVATPDGLAAIELLARSEAIIANPVYTGKALAAMLADARSGVIKPGETVVYMHTGGDPLVYVYADVLAQHAHESEKSSAAASA